MADDLPAVRVELFRDAMAALASGVAVVTARRADGSPAGLLATSIAAYSAEPPSILLSIAHSSRSHPTLVEHAERFGVHLLGRDQEPWRRPSRAGPTTSTRASTGRGIETSRGSAASSPTCAVGAARPSIATTTRS